MSIWLTALILAVLLTEPIEPHGEAVFTTGFEEDADANFDGWPDGWTRRRGEGFPQYLPIGIVDDLTETGSRCLRIELDGGAATVLSAPIAMDPKFSYLLTGRIRTERLQHNVASYTVTFFDAQRQQRESYESPHRTHAPTWQSVDIGPMTPASADARWAVIGVHVLPTESADLQGAAMFDDIRLVRLPYLMIRSGQPQNLFRDPQQVEISCSVSGLGDRKLMVQLELIDVSGTVLETTLLGMEPVAEDEIPPETSTPVTAPLAEDLRRSGWQRTATWRPHVPGRGYFTVRGTLQQAEIVLLQQTTSLAVMESTTRSRRTEFAWSLRKPELPLATEPFIAALQQARVGWLKVPLLHAALDPAALDEAASLAATLSAVDIKVVGVLGALAAETDRPAEGAAEPMFVDLFRSPTRWQPAVDPLVDRLSLTVQHWQLGGDHDDSLTDDPGLSELVRSVRQHWRQLGYPVRVGVGWPWLRELPAATDRPWEFLSRWESVPFTDRELDTYARSTEAAGAAQWFAIQPLSASTYAAETRARDLVLRMVAAKVRGAGLIAVDDPLHEDHGLLARDGTPTALFVPWCLAADLLGGAKYAGTLTLPQGSSNHIFVREEEVVLVLWNEREVLETVHVNGAFGQLDLWGRETTGSGDEPSSGAANIAAGPLPTFLTGLDGNLIQWQLDCAWEPAQFATTGGQPYVARLRFRNPWPRDVDGTVTVRAPAAWAVRPEQYRFRLAAEEQQEREFVVQLQSDADHGTQRVRIEFDIEADRRYQFCVYRDIQVGTGDILLELDSWPDAAGPLIVEQRVTNTTSVPVSLNCYLQAPGRRRLRHQIVDLPPGQATHTFSLPDGDELYGKTLWLRVEEMGGRREWNCRAVVEP